MHVRGLCLSERGRVKWTGWTSCATPSNEANSARRASKGPNEGLFRCSRLDTIEPERDTSVGVWHLEGGLAAVIVGLLHCGAAGLAGMLQQEQGLP
jgi:hypothetical protein